MLLRFDEFELDALAFELRRHGRPVAVEPQVLALILFLAEHRGRMVTRDEIFAAIWRDRIVSDAALSSRIKSARQVLDDDRERQCRIRTIHGRGFRFVGAVDSTPASVTPNAGLAPPSTRVEPTAKPSLAVVPFQPIGDPRAGLFATALPYELITELSRLRWLFVIARGSSFRLAPAALDLDLVRDVLGARYCLSGMVEIQRNRIVITVELADTGAKRAIWCERYDGVIQDVHDVRARMLTDITSALDVRIPAHEAELARLRTPDLLDAWGSYHLGLERLYRFNAADNAMSITLFDRAVSQQPDFARAHAALSFARFQNAFLGYGCDRGQEAAAARRSAETALACDALDPFVLCSMGRSLWLDDQLDASLGWLDRSIRLNPNYAQGIYARAWTETVLGNGEEGQRNADSAMALSPIDPLHYAMLATRALSHLVRGEMFEAAAWGDKAARAPGAHALIAMIAVAAHTLNGDDGRARRWAENVRGRIAVPSADQFLTSFPFADASICAQIRSGLKMVDG